LDRLIREFDLTHAEAAEAVGRSSRWAMRGHCWVSPTPCSSWTQPARW
jgi:hypothetical protein